MYTDYSLWISEINDSKDTGHRRKKLGTFSYKIFPLL